MSEFYRGRTALVTGASSGIGAACARDLAGRGARVVLVARREGALEETAAAVRARGAEAVVVPADLEPSGAAEALAGRLAEAGETVDVLVNNAGFGVHADLLDTDPDAARGMIALNAGSLTALTRAFLPGMVARGRGGVLHVASVAGFSPVPGFAVYAATKAYVRSFSAAVRAETRGMGVAVTCLSPGPVETGFGRRAGVSDRFFKGGLSAEAVARAGLDALAGDRREVVPGWLTKAQTLASRVVPAGVSVAVARRLMERGRL